MKKSLQITDQRLEDFSVICKIDRSLYEGLFSALDERKSTILNIEQASNIFKENVGEHDGDVLFSQVAGLAILVQDTGITPEDAVDALNEGMKQREDWLSENSSSWDFTLGVLKDLVGHVTVSLVIKSADLFSSYTSAIHKASIITDVRPVLSDSRDEMIGSYIVNTILIEYFNDSDSGIKKKSFALDYNDLKKLEAEVSKALKKTEAIKQGMAGVVGENNVIVAGVDN